MFSNATTLTPTLSRQRERVGVRVVALLNIVARTLKD
jgi:hypothetical protein